METYTVTFIVKNCDQDPSSVLDNAQSMASELGDLCSATVEEDDVCVCEGETGE